MPRENPSAAAFALLALLLLAALSPGCLEDDNPASLSLSVLGAATMPAVWNTTGLVEPPQNHTFLVVEVKLVNTGPDQTAGIRPADIRLEAGGQFFKTNFLSGDVSYFNVSSPNYTESVAASSIPSLMDALGQGESVQSVLIYAVPVGLQGSAEVSYANATVLGKERSVTAELDLGAVRAYASPPPRVAIHLNTAVYLNRTAGGPAPMRYLVANLTLTDLWYQPFILMLLQMRLVDGDGMSHPILLGLPWLNGPLADGPVLPGVPRSGSVAFDLPPPMVPARIVLDDAVPVTVELDPAAITYGK